METWTKEEKLTRKIYLLAMAGGSVLWRANNCMGQRWSCSCWWWWCFFLFLGFAGGDWWHPLYCKQLVVMALLQVHPPLNRGHSQEGGEGDKDGEPSPEGTWAFREPGEAGRQPSVRGEGRRPAPSGEGRRPTSGEGREEGEGGTGYQSKFWKGENNQTYFVI